ncbi:MAG: C1 family peptidase, partial [Woeseia sp.]
MPDTTSAKLGKYELNVVADVPDFRDWTYQPALVQLANEIERPTRLHILDQGSEGSCTGFALAAVVNLQRAQCRRRGTVSPRMLYEMAKRHDEWRGDSYDGSSCRGAIKGWYNMGVCLDRTWPYKDGKQGMLTIKAAKEARENTLGAYYRLGTRVSDFHAALNETGVIFCSADIHAGWSKPSRKTGIIPLRDEPEGAHAFSIVGYNNKGFWIQNSWGRKWGQEGTALWLYEDWQHHLLDAWVLRLALPTPQIWHLPREGGSDAGRTEGLFRKTPTRAEIAGHFVHIDDGQFHDDGIYWSNLDDVQQTAELVA